jgi:hypothetical protein
MEQKSAARKLEAILSLARSDLASRRKSPWRWIIAAGILFGLIAGFAWWVGLPREPARPFTIMAADAIALPEEAISLVARIDNATGPADGHGLAGTPIVFQDSIDNSQQVIRTDPLGIANFTAAFRASALPVSWFARFAGDAGRKPVQARGIVFIRPPTTSWIVIDADHALPALAEGDFWKREGIDVPLMPGALAALRELKAKREICYIASSADTVNRHLRLKSWLGRGWEPARLQPPDGPLLSRATSEFGPAEYLKSSVADLQKRFGTPVTALAARPEEAQAFLAAGVRTLLLGDGNDAPSGAVVVKSWNDGLAAKVDGSAR